MKRPDFNTYFLRMARLVATRSTCLDKHVGCVLVDKDMHVISCGYNGAPAKAAHCTDLGSCAKKMGQDCRARHAEMNALAHCVSGHPVLCYCTLEPCKDCAKMLRNAGVQAVFFNKPTNPAKSGREEFGGHWEQITPVTINETPMAILQSIREYHKVLGYPQEHKIREDGLNHIAISDARDLCLAIQVELSEVVNSFDWKPWKKYNNTRTVDSDNFLEEIGDIVFFLDSLLMNFGFTWDDLFKRIDAKLDENYARINSGYHN